MKDPDIVRKITLETTPILTNSRHLEPNDDGAPPLEEEDITVGPIALMDVEEKGLFGDPEDENERGGGYDDEDEPKRQITTVIASAPTPDRYNDIVEPTWKLERFLANPIVPFGHDYTIPPVGRVLDLKVIEGELIAQIEWDDSPENELGRIVASQFRRGFLNAVSVGFAPGQVIPRKELPDESPYKSETGNLYRNPELLEISAVPIPAHPDALALRSHSAPELKHMVDMVETDSTYVVTYAKQAVAAVATSSEITSEARSMVALFGRHPLDSFFGH